MMIRSVMMLLAVCLVALLSGCTTMERSFPNQTKDQVWSAMVAVAERPEYKDWKVLENNVYANDAAKRIEVSRVVHRELWLPGGGNNPRYERRDWKFTITLLPEEPPTIDFVSRSWAVPMHARDEAVRYLDDVNDVLSGGKVAAELPK
jgi:hypothetical protein